MEDLGDWLEEKEEEEGFFRILTRFEFSRRRKMVARKDWMDKYVYIYFLGKIGEFGGLVRGKGRGGGGLIRFLEISRREYGDDWDPWMEMEDF